MSENKKQNKTIIALIILLIVAILLVIMLTASSMLDNEKKDLTVTDPIFFLDNVAYPKSPVLQDFMDRGWKLDSVVEYIGDYSEENGPSNIVAGGYQLDSGENYISVFLDEDAVRNDEAASSCKLRSISFYGDDVDSFTVNGKELSNINSEQIIDVMGEPDSKETADYGIFYYYNLPDQGIPGIMFSFPGTLDSVGQIMITLI